MLISSRTRCSGWHLPSRPVLALAALTFVLVLAGCKREVAQEAPPPRPVRSIVVERGGLGQSIVLTGQIQAEKEVALAFRIGGRIVERSVDTGDRVTPDQVVAKLDPQNELNSLRSARAALAAAKARLEQDSNHFDRQETLLKQGWTTRRISIRPSRRCAQPRLRSMTPRPRSKSRRTASAIPNSRLV